MERFREFNHREHREETQGAQRISVYSEQKLCALCGFKMPNNVLRYKSATQQTIIVAISLSSYHLKFKIIHATNH